MNVPSGYTALDLIGFTDQGDYDSSANYVKNDLAHYNNTVWRCLVDDTTNVTPVEGANWTVFIQNGTTLAGMADVNLTTPANADVLQYNSTASKWENSPVDSTPTQSSVHPVQSGGVYTQLANKANTADLAAVATSGAYADLSGTPSLATVATTGQYSDLSGTPSIPTVNDGTLTIQKNGTNVATFSANQSGNQTANISVPTKTSDLTNDSDFVSDANYQHITVDSTMSSSSANPVQNQAITVAHNSLKDSYVVQESYSGCKNILPAIQQASREHRGITFTPNGDGSFSLSGTATGAAFTYMQDVTGGSRSDLPIDDYFDRDTEYVVFISQTTQNARFVMRFLNSSGSSISALEIDTKTSATFKLSTSDPTAQAKTFYTTITLSSGDTAPSVAYPMIVQKSIFDTDPAFAKYAKNNYQLTKDSVEWDDMAKIGAVNLCKNKAITQTSTDGTTTFTWTVNNDNSVTVSAPSYPVTIASNQVFYVWENLSADECKPFVGKVFKLSGCPANGTDNYRFQAYRVGTTAGTSGTPMDYGEGAVFQWLNDASGTKPNISIVLLANGTIEGPLTFYPMITPAEYNGPYVPYANTNKGLTDGIASLNTWKSAVGSLRESSFSVTGNTTKTMTFSESAIFLLFIANTNTTVSNVKQAMYFVSIRPGGLAKITSLITDEHFTVTSTSNSQVAITSTTSSTLTAFIVQLVSSGAYTVS